MTSTTLPSSIPANTEQEFDIAADVGYSSFFDTQYMYQTHAQAPPSPPISPQFSWQVTTVDEDATTHTINDSLPHSKSRRTRIPPSTMSALMTGPDPQDGKYICLYAGCMRRFGRKYNIQSHIQTHLSDRPFRCPTCAAGFVRRHDLVRHARIHVTEKGFVCGCGKGFSRMDALTRHQQRQICVGGQAKSGSSRKRKDNQYSPVICSSPEYAGDSAESHIGSVSPEAGHFSHTPGHSQYQTFVNSRTMPNGHSRHPSTMENIPLALDLEAQLQMYSNVPRYTGQNYAHEQHMAGQLNLPLQLNMSQDMWANTNLISPAMTQSSHFQSDDAEEQLYYYS